MPPLLVLALVACQEPPADPFTACEVSSGMWEESPRELDLVLVVSDAPAMTGLQDRLIANLARFAAVLDSIVDGLPSLHLAVVAGSGGGFTTDPRISGCQPPGGAFLVDPQDRWWTCSDDPTTRCGEPNYAGALGDAMACMAALGSGGSAAEPLLASLQAALGDGNPDAGDFLRRDALLAVVIVSAEDDASPGDPADTAAFLRGLRSDPTRVTVSTVTADPAPRLAALRAALPQRAVAVSIDGDDWSDALAIVAAMFARVLGFPVLHGADPTDVDPDNPGLQLACVATDTSTTDPADQQIVSPCRMAGAGRPDPLTSLPCYWLDDRGGYLVPTVERTAPIRGVYPELRCAGVCD